MGQPYTQWQVRDTAQSPKLSKKLETGSSTWSRDNGELTGSPGVQEIEQKTSGITLEHDADIRMNDADPVDAARSPRNGRKRTGTDSAMEGSGFPVQQGHAVQSPKRTRAHTTRKVETAARGAQGLHSFSDSSKDNDVLIDILAAVGLAPASVRLRGRQQATVVDREFDRSGFGFEHAGETEDGGAARGTPQQRRLFDPARDHPAAFKVEDSSKRLEDIPPAVRSPRDSRTRRGQRGKDVGLYSSRTRQPQRNAAAPAQQQQLHQGSREGGRIMILNNVTAQQQHQPHSASDEEDENPRMVGQPETRPISPEQLIAEVKGIYAGLVMVEAKCCEVDAKQAAAAQDQDGKHPRLNNEQWQALIALHRTLLHEHHDFFLASQHPSASPSLRKLALKYAMPARMWRHGIHSFLELLRHRLPYSLEHMLTFIYLAYSMMALCKLFLMYFVSLGGW